MNTNNSFVCIQWSGYKYCYSKYFYVTLELQPPSICKRKLSGQMDIWLLLRRQFFSIRLFCLLSLPDPLIPCYRWFVYTQLNDQTVQFLKNQFSINHLFAHSLNVKNSIWSIDRTLSGVSTPGQSGPWNNGNEGVFHIPQISKTRASSSDCFVSYPGHAWGKSYLSAEMQSVYSTAPADRAILYLTLQFRVCRIVSGMVKFNRRKEC